MLLLLLLLLCLASRLHISSVLDAKQQPTASTAYARLRADEPQRAVCPARVARATRSATHPAPADHLPTGGAASYIAARLFGVVANRAAMVLANNGRHLPVCDHGLLHDVVVWLHDVASAPTTGPARSRTGDARCAHRASPPRGSRRPVARTYLMDRLPASRSVLGRVPQRVAPRRGGGHGTRPISLNKKLEKHDCGGPLRCDIGSFGRALRDKPTLRLL